ncbi:MAG: homocysteine biosynthesis protein [Bacillota bacterium]|nr:homocysteine biosynthesis protein [Bacillota bacterium]
MKQQRTFEEINQKIREGTVVVCTAEEIISLVDREGPEAVFDAVDVVTTATFGPMCSSGAFLNFGHSDPPVRLEKLTLNKVEAYGGLAAVDTYIGATAESTDKGYEYGGAHVICDLIDGREVVLEATSKGTDCYPARRVKATVTLADLNEAYLYNPRNAYQNYAAATNGSDRAIYTYMGTLLPRYGNITYATSGELSPLLKDPEMRTIGVGTRLLVGNAVGYVAWHGTQCNTAAQRLDNGTPVSTGATLAVVGNLREMNTEYISPAVFKAYGTSLNVGIGIPIPLLDLAMLKQCAIKNDEIQTSIYDYSVPKRSKPAVRKVTYAELQSGSVAINGKQVKTSPTTSLKKSREIAWILKEKMQQGTFLLQAPIKCIPSNQGVQSMANSEVIE